MLNVNIVQVEETNQRTELTSSPSKIIRFVLVLYFTRHVVVMRVLPTWSFNRLNGFIQSLPVEQIVEYRRTKQDRRT